ncbi:hypothetical protein [Spirochaeta isovalerica]|uniref:Membrane protein implicated in regulation of membrane protease activity n=1 Tax=Spirochaeta isovalerica TaxID=150 RepID=A0A841RF16_9SPIO|nr:hypothetical protein [Spirochaeta isovalerica]MBB6482583.1 membrane protein implicated in regulation of membrane protease activity [Spirochaeta isovalerica]
MNKKLNTFLFLIVGTIVNIGIMLILLILFLYLIGFAFTAETSSQLVSALTLGAVMLSVVGSYLIYSQIIKFINKKWDLEKYIAPLFKRKR